eukprot:TRINITY_DN22219_c0_g3_i1.p1 TRINITY_DN22219_c0_g3~~TRINITY_DN22219_c0_g3_i1.p1  ORF type:complete len:925 (-),score=96.65 TRINITY_DN22219_c0_g3_i1:101-2875(-)
MRHVGKLLGLLLHAVDAAQEGTWHWVDVAAVICPKNASAPALPPYSVGIEYDSTMDLSSPHIFGFMRTSNKAMTVSFNVVDALGKQVIPQQEVQLKALGQEAPSTCTCNTSVKLPAALTAAAPDGYGAYYGITCKAHDNDYCDKWWGNTSVGKWCCKEWCYVTSKKDCPEAYESQLVDGLYWSDLPCYTGNPRTEPKFAETCKWEKAAEANDPCACKNVGSLFSADMKAKFAPTYGSSCFAWDTQTCALNYGSQVDTWCCQNWCYVDKACVSAKPSLNAGMQDTLFWSANVCPDDPQRMAQCEFKPVVNKSSPNAGNCTCKNEAMPAELRPANVPANYGSQCYPHDALHCKSIYPGAVHDMWCCESWCWVDESCPGSQEHPRWPGHYRSKVECPLDPDAISSCPHSRACECINSPGTQILHSNTGNTNVFLADYGGSCKAWDRANCKAVWGPSGTANSTQSWDSSASNDWCCDSWCYVNETCPIAKKSWLGIGFYFSYETCDDSDETYREQSDECASGTRFRRLSARRRFSSGGGSSWSSPRRRSSPPAPPTPRRRSTYTAPTIPRRRRYPSPPRRRVRRRRSPTNSAPAISPTNTAVRRRTTSMNGQSYQTSSGTSYGYTSQPQMMNNYGGATPYQTSYGYSGYNAYPQKSNANIAMYAGGGFLAGAAAGYLISDAMHYNSYDYGGGYGYHRWDGHRRRMNRGRYCIVPEGRCSSCYHTPWIGEKDKPGDLIDCGDCYSRYDYCLDTSACYTTGGCGYQTGQNYNRDDLAATGFIPKDFQGPLKVTITKIESQDLNPNPLQSNICPPTTQSEREKWETNGVTQSLRMDLFVVLTKQEQLSAPIACDSSTYKGCGWDDGCSTSGAFCAEDNTCKCPPGACYDRNRGRCSADQTLQQDGTARGELAWLLVMALPAWVFQMGLRRD